MQQMLRTVVDRYAPPAQREWYNKPNEAPSIIVSASDLTAAALTSLTIPLRQQTRRADERAVLRFKQRESVSGIGGVAQHNRCALLWLPGRNDSFFHTHLLDGLLHRCGFDVFALDMRRCGEAKRAADGVTPVVDDLLAHDCGAFEEYFEEMDEVRAFPASSCSLLFLPFCSFRPGRPRVPKYTNDSPTALHPWLFRKALRFLRDPTALDIASGVTEGSGCGRQYDRVVCYAHSTGALTAALYGMEGKRRDAIDGFVLNSPFWSWNVPLYQRVALRASQAMVSGATIGADETQQTGGVSAWIARATEFDASFQLAKGGDASAYSVGMRRHYEFPKLLKSTRELAVTAGWAAAVGNVQARLRAGELAIAGTRPTLCLYTDADEVLGSDDIDTLSDLLVPGGGADGKGSPIWSDGLVERKIETSEWDPSCHDVLAAPSKRRNREAFSYVEDWLKARE